MSNRTHTCEDRTLPLMSMGWFSSESCPTYFSLLSFLMAARAAGPGTGGLWSPLGLGLGNTPKTFMSCVPAQGFRQCPGGRMFPAQSLDGASRPQQLQGYFTTGAGQEDSASMVSHCAHLPATGPTGIEVLPPCRNTDSHSRIAMGRDGHQESAPASERDRHCVLGCCSPARSPGRVAARSGQS